MKGSPGSSPGVGSLDLQGLLARAGRTISRLGARWVYQGSTTRGETPFPDCFTDRDAPPSRGVAHDVRVGPCGEAGVGMAEVLGGFRRFAHPRLLAGDLGLVPSERTSDDKRRQGGITMAGPAHSRRLLVEAAHERLAARQAGQDRIWEAAVLD
jgi:hypothetical protein